MQRMCAVDRSRFHRHLSAASGDAEMQDHVGSTRIRQSFELLLQRRVDDGEGDAVQIDAEAGEACAMLPQSRDDQFGRIARRAGKSSKAGDEDRATGSIGVHPRLWSCGRARQYRRRGAASTSRVEP